MEIQRPKFLEFFPDHVYRYLDQTGLGRFAISSNVIRQDFNISGYCSYFTVNGFKNFKNQEEAKKEPNTDD